MDWTSIIVALISAGGVALTTLWGQHKQNNLILYRIEQLEKKVSENPNVQKRVLILEQKVDRIEPTLDKLQERVAVHGDQIDQAMVFSEKNETRISMLERSAK